MFVSSFVSLITN